MNRMKEVDATEEMIKEANRLCEGGIQIIYLDGKAIRMETVLGDNPYVWRDDTWRIMRYG